MVEWTKNALAFCSGFLVLFIRVKVRKKENMRRKLRKVLSLNHFSCLKVVYVRSKFLCEWNFTILLDSMKELFWKFPGKVSLCINLSSNRVYNHNMLPYFARRDRATELYMRYFFWIVIAKFSNSFKICFMTKINSLKDLV